MYDITRNEYMIRCPYCFQEFPQTEAIFRAHTAFDRSQLDLGNTTQMGGLLGRESGIVAASPSVDENFLRFDSEGGAHPDTKLVNYWKERGGSSGYVTADSTWDHPHIDPKSAQFDSMICKEPRGADIPDAQGFVRDKDGFILRVLEKYEDSPNPMERLCPNCHNPMPLADYGKYPVKFISVVGITGAGKTVFLNQLLTKFANEISGTDFSVDANNLAAIGESVNPRQPLPAATDDKIMRRPLAVTLKHQNGRRDDHMTLVFYDIAGENCVNDKGDPYVSRAKSLIGQFIAFCDGMIFLLDPDQIPIFANGMPRPNNIANVVNVLSTIRTTMNLQTGEWRNIPVAICLAKSDKLADSPFIPQDSPIFSHTNKGVNGFDRDEHKIIHDFLRNSLMTNADGVYAPLSVFQRSAFFAVSAITCGVESRFEKYQNQYILSEENEGKYQRLRDWVKGWNARTPENRAYYRVCPVRTAEGDPIKLDTDYNITKENARDIITEIRADSVEGEAINLTLWDVVSEINLQGYPKSDPAPRRIGEPLRWILWQMGKIGPYYQPMEPPRRRPFQSKKSYQEDMDAFAWENEQHMREFYGIPENVQMFS